MSDVLLEVSDLVVGYGRGDIVHGVSLTVTPGEIVTIVGPNGAGKSTLLKSIAGVVAPKSGTVKIAGIDITGRAASAAAAAGVGFVPQEANVFRSLSVAENLKIGAWIDPKHTAQRMREVEKIFPVLTEKLRTRAGLLSGGQRQMVAFGMALMLGPKVLLLDEPSAGLSPVMVDQMLDTIAAVNRAGIAVLMVEQNAVAALQISHTGIVMASGRIAIKAEAVALLADRSVGELYLGAVA
jgi:branched-chain amino acid transport system ATP-binding protein/neutral amino acid transport system ATP-binding protein